MLIVVDFKDLTIDSNETKRNKSQKDAEIGKIPVKIDDLYPQSRMDKVAVPELFLTNRVDKKWPSNI